MPFGHPVLHRLHLPGRGVARIPVIHPLVEKLNALQSELALDLNRLFKVPKETLTEGDADRGEAARHRGFEHAPEHPAALGVGRAFDLEEERARRDVVVRLRHHL
jgi:hypothetical protein